MPAVFVKRSIALKMQRSCLINNIKKQLTSFSSVSTW